MDLRLSQILNEEEADGIDFPQLGGVQIGDDVQIGTNCIIQRGALSDTLIDEGAVLDNNVVIAHNVQVGERAVIIGSSHIAGSVDIKSFHRSIRNCSQCGKD